MSKGRPGTLVLSYDSSTWAIFRNTTVSRQDGRRLYFPCVAQRMFKELHVHLSVAVTKLTTYNHSNAENYFRKKQQQQKNAQERERGK